MVSVVSSTACIDLHSVTPTLCPRRKREENFAARNYGSRRSSDVGCRAVHDLAASIASCRRRNLLFTKSRDRGRSAFAAFSNREAATHGSVRRALRSMRVQGRTGLPGTQWPLRQPQATQKSLRCAADNVLHRGTHWLYEATVRDEQDGRDWQAWQAKPQEQIAEARRNPAAAKRTRKRTVLAS